MKNFFPLTWRMKRWKGENSVDKKGAELNISIELSQIKIMSFLRKGYYSQIQEI